MVPAVNAFPLRVCVQIGRSYRVVLPRALGRWSGSVYVQALNDLARLLPSRVAIAGPRAAGLAADDPMEIVVVVDDHHRPSLGSRLAQAAAVASESVPAVQPQTSLLSVEQWAERTDGETPEAHHNIWMAPDTDSRRDGAYSGSKRREGNPTTRKAVERARGPYTTKLGRSAKPEHR